MVETARQYVVLLADDDALVRNLVRRILEAAGFLLLCAADGPEALVLCRAYSQRIDVLLTDVDMPGMDGIALAQQITCERPETRVIFMSGSMTRGIPEDVPFILKPFSPGELRAKINEVLGNNAPKG